MPRTNGRYVLIIEDNFFMAQLLSEKIAHRGFGVVHAQDGQTGILEAKKWSPALILIDLPLAGTLDGFATVKQIRALDGDVPIVALFGTSDEEELQHARQVGVSSWLIKADANSTDIVDAVAQALGAPPDIVPKKSSPKPPERTKGASEDAISKASGIDGNVDQAARSRVFAESIAQLLTLPEEQISIIKLVDDLMAYAFLMRASDIHMEPFEDHVIARLRVDGILGDVFTFPRNLHSGIITRIKVLAGMRTDEHQAAQDGRFRMELSDMNKEFDVRVSIVPTYYGENAVLRLLAEQTAINSLDDLALTDEDRKKIRRAVQTPYGMILATGPTGSGKTTTLYTILKELNTREVQIITLEDPIEYSLDGVDQIQVNQRTGLTFATGLRSILRQDPNIIMVGEIRDDETASIAVNAALTGHKLLATLHTNDSATTLPRLLDMGVEPFLVASTINVAIGQRLVRMICEECRVPRPITEGEFSALKESVPESILDDHRNFFQGKGCAACNDTGYRGRMGIYEILEMNDFIREAVMRRADSGEVKKLAVKNGMTTLLDDGFKKALEGHTTIEEILRVIHE